MQWSSQIVWNSFSMHCGENTRGSYPKWVFLVSRWEEQRRLSSYQWTWIFFSLSLEVFKRKTDVSAEHRMSTLGITSNRSESMLWRAEDPPKSARVKLNFFKKNWRASLETGNKVRQVSHSPPFAWSCWTRNTHRYVWANSVRFHKMSSRFWVHFWKLALK